MRFHYLSLSFLLSLLVVLVGAPRAQAQPGTVLAHQKISDTEGGFFGHLDISDRFGSSVAPLGDLDGDGITDLAVGANQDGDGGDGRGAVYILFMNADGSVRAEQKISSTEGGFTGPLDDYAQFGSSVSMLGDLDGDGVPDLAVGARGDTEYGAVWVLFLNADGTVRAHQKISATEGGFTGTLTPGDLFGDSIAALGDLNSDGVSELAVGASEYNQPDPAPKRGGAWVLFLNTDGTVASHQKISDTEGGFTGQLDDRDWFGDAVAALGDLDSDGVPDLAVGALGDDDGGQTRGAVWILFMNADGTVRTHQKISSTEGDFTGQLDSVDFFGTALALIGDLNGDGVADLAAGAGGDDDGGQNRGAVWVLFLNADGTVKGHQKISDTEGGFTGQLDDDDLLGWSVVSLGDLDGDGVPDLAVGAAGDDDGGFEPTDNHGAVWVLFLNYEDTTENEEDLPTSEALTLSAAFPNPFQDGATVAYHLPETGPVHIAVYDVLGRRVRTLVDGVQAAGPHSALFDGADLPSGTYTVRAQHQGAVHTQRITLTR